MALITFATVAAHIADVTDLLIGKCYKVFDANNQAFYMVESEDGKVDDEGNIVEYKVTYSKSCGFQCTCDAGKEGFAHCTNASGVCKHVRWSVACALEEQEAFNRQDTLVVPAVKVEYTDIDPVTLARIARRDQEHKPASKRKVAYCQTRPAGFSFLK